MHLSLTNIKFNIILITFELQKGNQAVAVALNVL